jgi:mono/diheme cytochrome c family protein
MSGKIVLGFVILMVLQMVHLAWPQPVEAPSIHLASRVTLNRVGAVSYTRDVQPVFDRYCVDCHGDSRAENGLRLDDYRHTMQGTQYGPVVHAGWPSASTLIFVLDGNVSEEIAMPWGQGRLSSNQITSIARWIEQGAEND